MTISACTPTTVTQSGKRPSNGDSDTALLDATDLDATDASSDTDPNARDAGASVGQPCDENYAHSCAAGLVCAALDGQPATCMDEHSRDDGESCTAHVQCASYRCNPETQRCASSPGESCTQTNGCGPGPSGDNHLCINGTCVPGAGDNGDPCTRPLDCQSGACKDNQCVSGDPGDACQAPEHCQSGVCKDNQCATGNPGDECQAPEHCQSGICKDNQCATGNPGDECQAPEHCQSLFCLNNECTKVPTGHQCQTNEHCLSNLCVLGFCSDGELGDACVTNTDCDSGNCSEGICKPSGHAPGEYCDTHDECGEGRCVNQQCSTGQLGSFCSEEADCQTALSCDKECPEAHCFAICTDGKKGSPCLTGNGCDGEMRCTNDTIWQPAGAPIPFNSCSDSESCDFHLRECDDEDDWCLRTADGPICGRPGNAPHLAPCTDDTDCRSGVCSDHGFGNFKCSQGNGWEAPCLVVTIPEYPSETIGCDGVFVCDTTIGPPPQDPLTFGYCGATPGYFCYSKFESTGVTFDHRGGCAPGGVEACVPSTTKSKYCEHNPNLACNTDKECACDGILLGDNETCELLLVPGKQCITDYVCPF